MEDGPLHPSVLMKIQAKPCLFLFLHNVHKMHPSFTEAYTPAQTIKDLRSRSDSVSLCNSPILIGAPSERHGITYRKMKSYSYKLIYFMGHAPLERIKLLMQSQNEIIKAGRLSNPYKGTVNCFARTVRNEGAISLWRGSFPYGLAYISTGFLDSASKNYYWSMTEQRMKNKESNGPLKNLAWFMAGEVIISGTRLLLVYPLHYAHTRLANDIMRHGKVREREFNGLIDVLSKTFKSNGIAGIYRGFNISLVRSSLCAGVFAGSLAVFNTSRVDKLGVSQYSILVPLYTIVLAGGGLATELILYPMDTVARRMMMRSGEAVKYKNSLDAFSQILKTEGFRSLYKGIGALVLQTAFRCCIVSYTVLNSLPPHLKRPVDGGLPDSSFSIKWRIGRNGGGQGEE